MPSGDALRVSFSHADGLHADDKNSGSSLERQVHGFELAGPDNQFHPAEAVIDGTSVLVRSSSVADPTHVRYAWASYTDANLFNAAGLPASTFLWPDLNP
jgi:sialate O-acetylesterase